MTEALKGRGGICASVIQNGTLRVGDTIRVKGHTSDFTQTIDSMQIDRATVEVARVGDEIGIQVAEHAREHDQVFRVAAD